MSDDQKRTAKIHYSKGIIEAEIAESWKEKAIGLRGREKGAMLFDLDKSSKPQIDMILVKKKLQIIFLDENNKVLQVIHAEPGLNLYAPKNKCRKFLETFAFTDIRPGEKLEISRT